MKPAIFSIVFSVLTFFNYAQPLDYEWIRGLYQDQNNRTYIFSPTTGFPHFTEIETGEVHMLRSSGERSFEFTATRSSWDAIGGKVIFESDTPGKKKCTITFLADGDIRKLQQIKLNTQPLALQIKPEVTIAGELITPLEPVNQKIAILLHGDGDNNRYDLYDIGMHLVAGGMSFFMFDKRNVGASIGPEIEGNNYDEISRVYAQDAIGVINELRKTLQEINNKDIGVIGLSQGGWLGAIVSAQVSGLAFYVNISGNGGIGWQQWRHYMESYLKRNGFSPEEVAEAENYFDYFFDLGLNKVDIETYQIQLEKHREKTWFKILSNRKLIEWEDKKQAIRVLSKNMNDPSKDFKKVNAPTLGLFFQFDHSSTPDTPVRFLDGIIKSNAPEVTVRVFPKANHGMWTVPSYYFNSSKISGRNPEIFKFLNAWLLAL